MPTVGKFDDKEGEWSMNETGKKANTKNDKSQTQKACTTFFVFEQKRGFFLKRVDDFYVSYIFVPSQSDEGYFSTIT
jgi:hypothetical protein